MPRLWPVARALVSSGSTQSFGSERPPKRRFWPPVRPTIVPNDVRESSAHRPGRRQALDLVVGSTATQGRRRRDVWLDRDGGSALLRRQHLLLPLSVLGQLSRPDRRPVCRAARDSPTRGADDGGTPELDRPAVARPLDLLRGMAVRRLSACRRRLLASRRFGVRASLCASRQSESSSAACLSLDARRVHRVRREHGHPGAELCVSALRTPSVADPRGRTSPGPSLPTGRPAPRSLVEPPRDGSPRNCPGSRLCGGTPISRCTRADPATRRHVFRGRNRRRPGALRESVRAFNRSLLPRPDRQFRRLALHRRVGPAKPGERHQLWFFRSPFRRGRRRRVWRWPRVPSHA